MGRGVCGRVSGCGIEPEARFEPCPAKREAKHMAATITEPESPDRSSDLLDDACHDDPGDIPLSAGGGRRATATTTGIVRTTQR